MSVLLVEDNPSDARLLREMLKDAGGDGVHLTEVGNLDEAFRHLDAGDFDVVLLDLGLPDSRGLATFTTLHQRYEDTPIVVWSGLDDEEVAITAVQEGAQDYLLKKRISAGYLLRSIEYAIERHTALKREINQYRRGGESAVIAFIGAKGGVGVTTVTLNFGAVLATSGRSATAVELRGTHGSFASLLSRTPVENLSHLVDLGAPQINPREVSLRIVKTPFGMNALYGPQEAREEIDLTADQAAAIVDSAAAIADFTLLDIPCWPSEASHGAMRDSWRTFLVCEPEPASIREARVGIDSLRTAGISGQLAGAILVNRAAVAVGITPKNVEDSIGLDVLAVIPPAAEACAAAQRSGTPVVLAQPDSVFTSSFIETVDRLTAERIAPQTVW